MRGEVKMSIAQWGIKGTCILVLCCIASPVARGMIGIHGFKFRRYSFHEATAKGYGDAVERFLDRGTPVNKRNRYYKTALYYASRYGRSHVTQLLLRWGASVVGIGADPKETALHVAAGWNQPKVVKMLLQHDATLLERQDSQGQTALHRSCAQGHVKVVKILLGFGANPSQEDGAGQNAWTHGAHGPKKKWRQVIAALKESETQRRRVLNSVHKALSKFDLQDLSQMICLYADCQEH